jgi:hypothetical protein
LSLLGEEQKRQNRRVKYWRISLAIFAMLSASLALAEDFKTINGKEYKNATVSRIEPDGVVLKSKSGIAKVYFTELPKEIQERFHYNPAPAATAPPLRQPPVAPTTRQKMVVQAREDARKTNERHQEAVRLAKDNSTGFAGALFGAMFVITIIIAVVVIVVAIANAYARKQRRALIVKQAQEFVEEVKQKLTLPIVPTDIMLKPDEHAFYSSPSALHETRRFENTMQPTLGRELPKAFMSVGQVAVR